MPSKDVAASIISQVRETDLLLMGASRYAGKLSSLFTSEVEERVMEGLRPHSPLEAVPGA